MKTISFRDALRKLRTARELLREALTGVSMTGIWSARDAVCASAHLLDECIALQELAASPKITWPPTADYPVNPGPPQERRCKSRRKAKR